jgi:hypothetical protein
MTVNGHADKGDEWGPDGRVFVTRASTGPDTTGIARAACFLLPAGLLGGAGVAAVILAQRFLLAVAEPLAAVDVRGVLDLVLGHGQHYQLTVELRSADRREALPGAKQAGLYQHPLWLAGLLVAGTSG